MSPTIRGRDINGEPTLAVIRDGTIQMPGFAGGSAGFAAGDVNVEARLSGVNHQIYARFTYNRVPQMVIEWWHSSRAPNPLNFRIVPNAIVEQTWAGTRINFDRWIDAHGDSHSERLRIGETYFVRFSALGASQTLQVTILERELPEVPNPPGLPQTVVTGVEGRDVRVSYGAPRDSVVDTYEIEHDSGGVGWGNRQTTTGLSHTYRGLLANTTYRFRVRAVNRGGESEWAYSRPTTTGQDVLPEGDTVPGAPSLTALPSQRQPTTQRIDYSQPTATPAVTHIQYRIRGTWVTIPDSAPGGANSGSFVITGLVAERDYKVDVRAVNAIGAGPASNSVTVLRHSQAEDTPDPTRQPDPPPPPGSGPTPETPVIDPETGQPVAVRPTAVIGLDSQGEDGAVSVAWDDDLTIDKWHVEYRTGRSAYGNRREIDGDITSQRIDNLTNGVPVDIRVRKVRDGQFGDWTFTSATPMARTVIPPDAPVPPDSVASQRGNAVSQTSVKLVWFLPNTGGEITGIVVTGAGQTIRLGPDATSTQVINLLPDTSYTFTVTTQGPHGTASVTVTVRTLAPVVEIAPPGDVVISFSELSETGSRMTWGAPSTDGGSPVLGFLVSVKSVDGTESQGPWIHAPANRERVLERLTRGKAYVASVQPWNSAGYGNTSTASFNTEFVSTVSVRCPEGYTYNDNTQQCEGPGGLPIYYDVTYEADFSDFEGTTIPFTRQDASTLIEAFASFSASVNATGAVTHASHVAAWGGVAEIRGGWFSISDAMINMLVQSGAVNDSGRLALQLLRSISGSTIRFSRATGDIDNGSVLIQGGGARATRAYRRILGNLSFELSYAGGITSPTVRQWIQHLFPGYLTTMFDAGRTVGARELPVAPLLASLPQSTNQVQRTLPDLGSILSYQAANLVASVAFSPITATVVSQPEPDAPSNLRSSSSTGVSESTSSTFTGLYPFVYNGRFTTTTTPPDETL